MDPALLELASYTANGTLYASVGALFAYLGMDICFARRRSTALFWTYFLVKAFTMSAFDAAHVLGMLDGTLYPAFVGITCVFAFASYVVLYLTWNAEVLKIGLAGIFIDMISSCCVLLSLALVDGMLHNTPTLDYTGPFGLRSILLSGMYLVGFVIIRKLMLPLGRWIRAYEFRHRRLWQAFVVFFIASATATRFTGFSDYGLEIVFMIVEIPLLLCAVAAYVSTRLRVEQRKRRALERSAELMRSYDAAIHEQGESLAGNREALNRLAARVRKLEAAGGREELLAALQELRRTSDRIRFGIYSDCPALDAVLAYRESELDARGLAAEYAIAPFGGGHARLAQAAHLVLGWASQMASAADGPESTVRLRVSRAGNQAMMVLDAPMARNANFPRRMLDDVLDSPATVVESFDRGRKRLLVMFGDA